MTYASEDSVSEVQQKLQHCLININKWYRENPLKINSDKSKLMLVGSKAQQKSLNVDEFISNYEGTPLELVENVKWLGMSINSDISWDFYVQHLYQNMYYLSLLTHWGRDKMDAIFQTTFSNAFSCMKMYEFRWRFHWSLFLGFQLTISQHWFW